MRVDILTIFPEMFTPLEASIINRARQKQLLSVNIVDIRDYTTDKHRSVDDYPFGGGAGMVMKPEPLFRAVEDICGSEELPVILLTPQGKTFNQQIAGEFSKKDRLVLVCGHYEGVDERFRSQVVTEEISIGDYVLTGGELPAMVLVDAVARLLPGVLGDDKSAEEDSFAQGLLEYPHFTRPRSFRGMEVPSVLLSGNHEDIRLWRRKRSLERTLSRRPDLLTKSALPKEDRTLLKMLRDSYPDTGNNNEG